MTLVAARATLKQKQAQWARGLTLDNEQSLAMALEHAAEREALAVREGAMIRMGSFRYKAESEIERLRRTREVIARSDPGPNEDGGYLEMLAREAASAELFLASKYEKIDAKFLSRVIIGTIGQPRSHASTKPVGEYAVIAIAAGMMNAYYQFGKAVVLSWQQVDPTTGYLVSLDGRPEVVRAKLDSDSTTIDMTYDLLSCWLFEGVAQPNTSSAPELAYHPPLGLMINYAERFVVAHEYAHALIDFMGLRIGRYPAEQVSKQHKEFRADLTAMRIVAETSAWLDGVAPNIALQSAFLALKVNDIVDRARELVSGVKRPPSDTHPTYNDRAAILTYEYKQDYEFAGDQRSSAEGLYPAANTAELLWERVSSRLQADVKRGRALHPIWS